MVVTTEERPQTDDGTTGAHLLFEIVYQRPYLLYQLLLTFSERYLLILDVVHFVLVLLHKFLVALSEE